MKELSKFMDDNFKRSEGNRRNIDRRLMEGEWGLLLKVMGRIDSRGKRYVSLEEVRVLFKEMRLPPRMVYMLVHHGHDH